MTARLVGLVLTLMLGAALVAGVALVFNGMHFAAPVHVTVNGEDLIGGFDLERLSKPSQLALASLLVLALLVALVIVPVAFAMLLATLVLVALALLGLPLIALVALLTLLLSPLLLIGWLIGRALRS